jgi:hypothetical protein
MLSRSLGPNYFDVIPFVRQNVMRSMAGQVSPVRKEISLQLSKHFTTPNDSAAWRSVPVWPITFTMMCSIAARFLVGELLCHNEAFTKKIGEFTRAVSIEAMLLRKFPAVVRPVVVKFLKSKARVRSIKEMLRQQVMACMMETVDGAVVLAERESSPNDPMLPQFVAYVLPKCADSTKPAGQIKEKILDEVVGRMLGLFFAAVSIFIRTKTGVVDIR